jgi:ATP-dependent helicase/nuclease subunit B
MRQLTLAAPGPPAQRALWRAIDELKADDPLAPVTVAVPSAYAGLSLRRALAGRAGTPGLVNVRFLPLNRVAELLGAPALAQPDRRPLTPAVRAAAVRAALADEPGVFGPVATHGATERAVAATLRDLAPASDAALARLSNGGGRRAESVARICLRFRALTAAYYDDEDQLRSAAALVAAGGAAFRDIGALIVFLPRDLTPAAMQFIAALAARGHVAVVLGHTGLDPADAPAQAIAAHLASSLGPAEPIDPIELDGLGPLGATRVTSCPDPHAEAQAVVRGIVERLEAGTPLHRIAVTYRNAVPYARLLHEELATAELPANGASPRTLAHTASGRTLLGLLRLPDVDFQRDAVMAVVNGAPVRETRDGRTAPGPDWDRCSCAAHVVAGIDEWTSRLDRAITRLREVDPTRGHRTEAAVERDVGLSERLRAFVIELAAECDPGPRRSWAELATWSVGLLDRYLGRPGAGTTWPAEDLAADDALRERLLALATLDEIGGHVDRTMFVRAVEQELATPVGHIGRFGDGVFVAPLTMLAGTEFDAVFVVGLAEGTFPPPARDDPVLSDSERALVPDVAARADAAAREHADFLAALAAAPERALFFPRADPRSGRELRPARWALDTIATHAGRAVYADDLEPTGGLAHEAATAGWFEVVPSFEAGLVRAPADSSAHDYDLRTLLSWHRGGHALGTHPLVTADRALSAGFDALAARNAAAYGVHDGVIGPIPGLAPRADVRYSPTSLETWADCPFRYLLARVLHVREVERPEALDHFPSAPRGKLIHEALERFAQQHPSDDPDAPWSPADRARLQEIGDELCDGVEADGITGPTLLWRLERRRILRELVLVLDTDEEMRAARRVVPVGVEVNFGVDDDGLPALDLELRGTPVSFRGHVDRVDRAPNGSRIELFDYKTGKSDDFRGIAEDPVLRGTKLQLAIYALALRAAYGVPVHASYWFTRTRGADAFLGFELDGATEARITSVLESMVASIGDGLFPAYPGAEGHYGPDNCGHCPYTRLCPHDRVRRWDHRIDDPVLRPFRTLQSDAYPAEVSAP